MSNFPPKALLPRGLQSRPLLTQLCSSFLALARYYSARYQQVRPRPNLPKAATKKIAADLHAEMYRHLAAGNIEPIEKLLCSGLRESLQQRIRNSRGKLQRQWTLHKQLSPPKLVSYKVMLMERPKEGDEDPKRNMNGFVQAIVRLHTLQSLVYTAHISKRDGERVPPHSTEPKREIVVDVTGREIPREKIEKYAKKVVEYVVVQQQMIKSELQPWKLWGMTEETTLKALDEAEKNQSSREDEFKKQMNRSSAMAAMT